MRFRKLRTLPWVRGFIQSYDTDATCDALMLHGDGSFRHLVYVTKEQQLWFEKLFEGQIGARLEQNLVARLDFPESKKSSQRRVFIVVDEERIGSCPAHIGNQCRDWLAEWGLSDATVYCNVRALCEHPQGAVRYLVRLDLERPFKMTTYFPETDSPV